jgi:hypothetical protein
VFFSDTVKCTALYYILLFAGLDHQKLSLGSMNSNADRQWENAAPPPPLPPCYSVSYFLSIAHKSGRYRSVQEGDISLPFPAILKLRDCEHSTVFCLGGQRIYRKSILPGNVS